MSFQVGDWVVAKSHPYGKVGYVAKVDNDGYFYIKDGPYCNPAYMRHATQQEIAAGHRIDHSVHDNEMIELSGNSEELEVLEMIDVSPNCGVSEL